MDKVTLPKEVAEAIENTRRQYSFQNYGIVRAVLDVGGCKYEPELACNLKLIKEHFEPNYNNLLHALVNGYTVEPEYVSFEEAMKALKEGERLEIENPQGVRLKIGLDTRIQGSSFADIFEWKWIERP